MKMSCHETIYNFSHKLCHFHFVPSIITGQQLEDFCLEQELALANTMFKQHPRRLYTWTSPDGNTLNQIDYISTAQRWKTSLMNCRTYPGADCDTDH